MHVLSDVLYMFCPELYGIMQDLLKEAIQTREDVLDFGELVELLAHRLAVQTHVAQVALDLLEPQLHSGLNFW